MKQAGRASRHRLLLFSMSARRKPVAVSSTQNRQGEVDKSAVHAKLIRRIVPFLFVCYVISYLDRVNVGFAALTMNKDIGLTPTAFGIGAGLFFFGYFIAEIPSNLIMMKVGARIWIARIMITWGIVSALTALVTSPVQFGIARFLLGIGEAGFVPGVFLYISMWFPAAVRARATSLFLLGIPVANIVGSPISGALISVEGFGLKGWQWLLILEALPAVVLGVMCLFVLTDHPERARWLTGAERDWLVAKLAAEKAAIEKKHKYTLAQALRNWRVLTLAFINFCSIIGSLGVRAVAAADHQAARAQHNGGRVRGSSAVSVRSGRDGRLGPHVGSRQRPHHLSRGVAVRRRVGAAGQYCRQLAGHHDRGALPRSCRDQLVRGHLLGGSRRISNRASRGGRHRHDRLNRQPWRLRRAVHDRPDQGFDPKLHGAAHRGRVLPPDWLRPDDCLRPPRSSGCGRRAAPGRRLTVP